MTIIRAVDRGSQDQYSSMIPSIPRAPEENDEGYAMPQQLQQNGGGLPVQSLGPRLGYGPPTSTMHPPLPPHEGFREKPPDVHRDSVSYPYHPVPHMQAMDGTHSHSSISMRRLQQQQPMPLVGIHGLPMHQDHHLHGMAIPMMGGHVPPPLLPQQQSTSFGESQIAYVLARQFKSNRTGDRLGFPAYSHAKELLGFYRESSVGVTRFISHHHSCGPSERHEAVSMFHEAIRVKSDAVHALADWGTMVSLLDHAMVYDWSKDIGGGASGRGRGAQSRSSTPSD
jgi:hypothetical protein